MTPVYKLVASDESAVKGESEVKNIKNYFVCNVLPICASLFKTTETKWR